MAGAALAACGQRITAVDLARDWSARRDRLDAVRGMLMNPNGYDRQALQEILHDLSAEGAVASRGRVFVCMANYGLAVNGLSLFYVWVPTQLHNSLETSTNGRCRYVPIEDCWYILEER